MKFKQIILALFSASALFLGSEAVLEKTEDEALKFLVDQGHITGQATVDSFAIDRNGNIRLRVEDGGQIYSYGLEEVEDTYQITFMSKKKATKTATKQEQNDQITALLQENLDILQGGKVTKVTRQSGRKNNGEAVIDYTHNSKEYEITAYYNAKRGDLNIKSIKQKKVSQL